MKSTNSLYLGGESQEARQTVNLKEILKNFLREKYFWWLLESNVTRLTDLQLLVGPKKISDKQGILKKIQPKHLQCQMAISPITLTPTTFEIFNWKKEIFILIKSDD